ncbi:MAG: hypothetical protein GY832_20075 [Chloroflexi bacterium]|nr:hypothetical protein [Chloroflexota bacterium]
MFVQIGDQAFDPKGATVRFVPDGEGGTFAVLSALSGAILPFCGEDYDAFMDWWERCAGVTKFPNGNGHKIVTVTVKKWTVEDVSGLPPGWDYQIFDVDTCSNCGGLTDCEECNSRKAKVQYK